MDETECTAVPCGAANFIPGTYCTLDQGHAGPHVGFYNEPQRVEWPNDPPIKVLLEASLFARSVAGET